LYTNTYFESIATTPASTNTHHEAYGAIKKNRIKEVMLDDSAFIGILNIFERAMFTP
jgi:hypothetical protein